MPSRYRILLVTTLLVLVLDQVSKFYIDQNFKLYQSLPVIRDFFSITYVRSQGAAFGMLAQSSYRVPFFIAVALIAAVVIIWAIHRLRKDQRLAGISLSLIFSGAVGNLIDRVRFGEVIDFLDAHWYQHHWPAFNVADSAISIGVGLLMFDMLREDRRKRKSGLGDK